MELLHIVRKMNDHFVCFCAHFFSDYEPLSSHTCVSAVLASPHSQAQSNNIYTDPCAIVVLLTSAFCVHSNVYGLGDIQCIRYLTVVDSILTHTAYSVQTYHHMTSCSVKVPNTITARNPTSIGEEPVAYDRFTSTSIRRLVSQAEQSTIITFTNVLQGDKTVVLVCCSIE